VVLTGGVPLIDVSALSRSLPGPAAPTVIDVRYKLGGPPGREGYLAGHIPGAAFLDLDRDLTGPPGAGGRHPLPEPGALQEALRAAGVRTGHPVVAYDAGDGLGAARLWWTLRWAGHRDVSVLDGGLAAWVAAGHPVEPGAVVASPGDVVVAPGGMPVLDADAAAALAKTGVLLDARAPVRYRGEQEPIDAVPGHIPGAVNLPSALLFDGDGRLRPAGEVVAAFEAAAARSPAAEADAPVGTVRSGAVGAYCGSGVTAAQTVLALHAAGIEASLYVGSWSEWIRDEGRPVARGDRP
jgi:thiosulfate/3-mercaptopyruvate sulfurtransferase